MKVLIVGAGGREHAIAWKISQNEKVKKIFILLEILFKSFSESRRNNEYKSYFCCLKSILWKE